MRQIDFCFIHAPLKRFNDGYQGALICTLPNIFTIQAIPMKTLDIPAYQRAVKELCESDLGNVDQLQSDRESSLLSAKFRASVKKDFNVDFVYLSRHSKSFCAERGIGMVKDRLSMSMHSEPDPVLRLNWMRLLPTIIAELNNRMERSCRDAFVSH